jgi:UrcA family protein
MRKNRIAILGSAMVGAALLCGTCAANAQAYERYDYDYRPVAPPEERVIVHPYYPVEKRQLLGRINGELNPTEYRLSREVAFSDLDLSQPLDRAELRARVRHTARDLCSELNARVPELRGYPSEDRECVRKATQQAMADVYYYRRG